MLVMEKPVKKKKVVFILKMTRIFKGKVGDLVLIKEIRSGDSKRFRGKLVKVKKIESRDGTKNVVFFDYKYDDGRLFKDRAVWGDEALKA